MNISILNDKIITITNDWKINERLVSGFTLEQKEELVKFYDLVTSLFVKEQDQFNWVNRVQFNYDESLVAVIMSRPEELTKINLALERLLNP
jgi:hypothetical protein